jgi:L-ascorbate metabolism protein UlaG (beta-lactamase superfamily)
VDRHADPALMKITYLGTATLAIELGDTRLLTDPVFDPAGTRYDFGPWYAPRSWFESEKTYATPAAPEALGDFDAVLVSHDQHADNLDLAGRRLLADEARARRVVTTQPGARRLARAPAAGPGGDDAPGQGLGLGERVVGLAPGGTTRVGDVSIRATVARHGPPLLPQVDEVIGFLVDVPRGPRIWISGDTVLFPALQETLAAIAAERAVDVAIVHCGAVGFPRVPGLSGSRFTFDGHEAAAACRALDAGLVLPVHRSGWAHFRQPEGELLDIFDRAGLGKRTRLIGLGDTISL